MNKAALAEPEPIPADTLVRAFASYSQERIEDKNSVGRLVAELRLRGLTTFHDNGSFVDGDAIETRIADELDSAAVYIPFLTSHALQSRAVCDLEFKPAARRARAGGLRIVALAHGLGADHKELTQRTWEKLAYPFDARWTHISRGTLELEPGEAAAAALKALRAALPPAKGPSQGHWHVVVATRGDRPTGEQLVVDATEFLGGRVPRPGTPADWQRFFRAVQDLAAVMKEHSRRRELIIEPCCHLTGAVASGFVFRPGAQWRPRVVADDRHTCARSGFREHPGLSIQADDGSLDGTALSVEVGLLPQPIAPAVERTLAARPAPRRRLLVERTAVGRRLEADELAAMAGVIADRLKRERNDCAARRVDLYLAAPAAFAVRLGTELGGVGCPIQLHEHVRDHYQTTLELEPS
jgi:hypothetical protein